MSGQNDRIAAYADAIRKVDPNPIEPIVLVSAAAAMAVADTELEAMRRQVDRTNLARVEDAQLWESRLDAVRALVSEWEADYRGDPGKDWWPPTLIAELRAALGMSSDN